MRFVAIGQGLHYLTAPRPATVEASVALSPDVEDTNTVWERIELPYGRIALRTPYGRFLSCQLRSEQPRLTLSDDLGPREAFEEILWPNGEVSFRTCELTYLSVDPEPAASLVCDGKDTGAAEKFRYSEPPDDVIERAEAIVRRQPQVPDMPRQFAHTAEELRDSPNGNGQG